MASYQYIYVMKGLNKTFPGGKQVLKDIWLSFLPGAKIGVLGLNGSGKSTLLKIMAGRDDSYTGEAWAAEGVKVGLLEQEPGLDPAKDVLGNVMDGAGEMAKMLARFEEVSNAFSDPDADMDKLIAEQGELQEKIDAGNGWDLGRTVEIAMDALRCPPSDANVEKLSGGEKRRVALCRLLLSKPDMLLLDEPTNHLDAESVAWLERHLAEFPGTVVAVTHDRYFLDNVAGWILELDRGAGIPWEGNYSSWLKQKDKRLELEEKTADARRRTMQRELEWMGTSPSARRSKSKARIAAYEQMVDEDSQQTLDRAQIVIPAGPRLGDHVIRAEGISKGFGDRLLIDNLTFNLPPGGIVGVIGPNGAGKTTLFKMITGLDKPDTGTFSVGPSVKLGYVDQSRETLDPNKSVWEELSGGLDIIKLGTKEVSSRAYCGSFNFKGADQQKKVGQLSGGERNRVNLAKMLKSGANVLLLDEPTNDLDVDTLRALEEALVEFAGCAVVISHDRWFLDRTATHMLAFEGDSHVEWFEGNYQDYELDRHRRLGTDADQPHRIKYKPLVR
ncbi:energy-dependent translational throttle protein EttA [Reyranella sp.]|jgi:ATP-binding cassette ChvD family protein|uniref:energy-dependent translational throttle protein EttA n=1 Tax=Reyranella sp. TaxID=1929291 RepID=UPI000BCD9780|nr:energy-dependent translational throttle protein EttA [Reyranella sp.]OYY47028.1 MAG: energy-dependent translational throttle protein EttA [Rhodospirillales bacterium 35-66-84]OYZ97048.1 MAG: energy-dependent translational throttle protein EttA [Rhodospirillales bacterium 24-66-33]OZB27624.1 MAG: energy-dependent translational throttle protein EttA [Rhodospirillales bacterium 39-66-50]HQS13961.1 energy-dependent translational throttle protein EttA [Reyranella sp.]HQT10446.1 energy-dependent 